MTTSELLVCHQAEEVQVAKVWSPIPDAGPPFECKANRPVSKPSPSCHAAPPREDGAPKHRHIKQRALELNPSSCFQQGASFWTNLL